jgi:hypothetical protein
MIFFVLLSVVNAFMNQIDRIRLTYGKNIRRDNDLRLNLSLNLSLQLTRIIRLYVGRHQAKMSINLSSGVTPIGKPFD